jgi:uncharacterized circularly permuted ATP-grasp superfamily protein
MSYDEAHGDDGAPRPQYRRLLAALERSDLLALRETARRHVAAEGASFGDDPFRIDPVPRVFSGEAWDALAAGLEQRARALNAFVLDAYGEQRIVGAGLLDARVIDEGEGYERALRGRLPPMAAPIAIAGLDVVCDDDGTLRVLEDNCRTPSGYCYAAAVTARRAAALPPVGVDPRELEEPLRELLAGVVRDAAAAGAADPVVVVLSEGPGSASAWEHERVARLVGGHVVTAGDLRLEGGRLLARTADAGAREVDVVLRRTDDEAVFDDAGEPTATAALLLEPWLGGRLGLVNAFGTGIADDKLVHAHVEEMVRFYLGEEPLLASVPTYDLGRPELLEEVLDDLRAHVVKPRGGAGGRGVVVCAHADDDTLERLRDELRRDPGSYVAQRTVALSCHPTVGDEGGLEPRHVDLRPFVFSGAGWTRAMPGGLTRVALEPGSLVVNSSQGGGGKDTWVLASEPPGV